MAYVPPNSIIKLLADVPIDSSFDHTLWFESTNAQYTYFNSKAVRTFTNVSYVRKGRGYIKVEAPADQLYACNYMMYQNSSYGNKWFYAFCQVEYVNDNTSAVTFKIDNIQTWLFEFKDNMGQCFIERQHSETDEIGDNLVPEGLETGDYMYVNPRSPYMGAKKIVVACTFDTNLDDAVGHVQCGVYNGIHFNIFNFDDTGVAACNSFLISATNAGKSDGIICVFMCPEFVLQQSGSNYIPYMITYEPGNAFPSFQGYVPKNRKLWTAPYISLIVKTPDNAAEYAYEYFETIPQFRLTAVLSTQPSILLEPMHYKTFTTGNPGTDEGQVVDNFTEGISLTGWPQCAFSVDAFKAWLAQNGATLAVNGALAVAGLGLTVANGIGSTGYSEAGMLYPTSDGLAGPSLPGMPLNGPDVYGPPQYMGSQPQTTFNPSATGMISSLGAIGNILAQIYQHSILPPHARGSCDATALYARGRFTFEFATKIIRREFAEIIDGFFSKFGYAIHKVKTPNIHARVRWTYIKTRGCQIHGNVPADAIAEIQGIFDNGITFWADTTNFGNYSLSNDVLLTP